LDDVDGHAILFDRFGAARRGNLIFKRTKMTDVAALKKANSSRWVAMEITSSLTSTIDKVANNLVAALPKSRYQAVAKKSGVPWFVIAVIHEREASQSWKANLAQGDPWNKVSIHVPRGRGPFGSWEEAAIDALANCDPHAANWKDWTAGGALTLLEEYNGLGYAARGKPSPYVWASTDPYVKGRFVADGHRPLVDESSLETYRDNVIIGDPEMVAERVVAEIRHLDPVHYSCFFQFGDMPMRPARRALERFGAEVVPLIVKALGPLKNVGRMAWALSAPS
jgi:lysozyme family protein